MRKYRSLFVQLPYFSSALSIIAINLAHHLWARYDITIFVHTLFVATVFVVIFCMFLKTEFSCKLPLIFEFCFHLHKIFSCVQKLFDTNHYRISLFNFE